MICKYLYNVLFITLKCLLITIQQLYFYSVITHANIYMTVQAKIGLVCTSNCANYKMLLEESAKLKLSAMIEGCLIYKFCKYQRVMLLLTNVMSH